MLSNTLKLSWLWHAGNGGGRNSLVITLEMFVVECEEWKSGEDDMVGGRRGKDGG